MVVYNYTGKEINAKVVYYGPALSGKTTNLEWIYSKIPVEYSGKMVSLRTQADRTIFFDFLPLDLGVVDGFRTRFMLYTVPGQVHYNATRKMVLKGVDGVVFVADSEPSRMQDNIESLNNLRENLEELGIDSGSIPIVLQWNKRDLPNGMDVTELERQMNPEKLASFEACALTGEGVYETLHALCQLIYRKLSGGGELGAPAADDGASLFGETIAQCLQEIDERPSAPVPLALDAHVPATETTEADDASVLAAILGGRDNREAPVAVATEKVTVTETENDMQAEAAMSFEFDAPDTPPTENPSATDRPKPESVDEVQRPAGPANSLGQALDDVLGQESKATEALAEADPAEDSSDHSDVAATTFEQPVDVIAELQSLSAEAVSEPQTPVEEALPEGGLDLDAILSEDGKDTENKESIEDDGGLGLIKDPRRLPSDASRELPPLRMGSGAVSVATAPSKTRILEVPVTLDSNAFEDGQSLRIVLNISVKR